MPYAQKEEPPGAPADSKSTDAPGGLLIRLPAPAEIRR